MRRVGNNNASGAITVAAQRKLYKKLLKAQSRRQKELQKELKLLMLQEDEHKKSMNRDDENDDIGGKIRVGINEMSKKLQQSKELCGEYEFLLFCFRLRENDPMIWKCLPNDVNKEWLRPGYGVPLGDALMDNTRVQELELYVRHLMKEVTQEEEDKNNISIASLLQFLRTTSSVDHVHLDYEGSDSAEQQQQHITKVTNLLCDAINQNPRSMRTLLCYSTDIRWTNDLCHTLMSVAAASFKEAIMYNVQFASLDHSEQKCMLSAYADGHRKERIEMVGDDAKGDCKKVSMSYALKQHDEETPPRLENEIRSLKLEFSTYPPQGTVLQHILNSGSTIWLRDLYLHHFHFDGSCTECLLEGLRHRNTVSSAIKDGDAIYATVSENPTMIQTLTLRSCTFMESVVPMLESFMHARVDTGSVDDKGIFRTSKAAIYVALPELRIFESSRSLFGDHSLYTYASWLALQPSVVDPYDDNTKCALSSSREPYSSTVGSQVQVLSVVLNKWHSQRFFSEFRRLARKNRIQLRRLNVELCYSMFVPVDHPICDMLYCLPELLFLRELDIGELTDYVVLKLHKDDNFKDCNDMGNKWFLDSLRDGFRENCSLYRVRMQMGNDDYHEGEVMDSSSKSASPAPQRPDYVRWLSIRRFIEACCQRNRFLVSMLTKQQVSYLPLRGTDRTLYSTMTIQKQRDGQDDPSGATAKKKSKSKKKKKQQQQCNIVKHYYTESLLYPMLLRTACQTRKMKLSYILCSLLAQQGDSIGGGE